MYVLPKGLENAWVMARGKGWVFRTGKWGETLLTAIGMSMVTVSYIHFLFCSSFFADYDF